MLGGVNLMTAIHVAAMAGTFRGPRVDAVADHSSPPFLSKFPNLFIGGHGQGGLPVQALLGL